MTVEASYQDGTISLNGRTYRAMFSDEASPCVKVGKYLANGVENPAAIAEEIGVSKGTVWKWWKEWKAADISPDRLAQVVDEAIIDVEDEECLEDLEESCARLQQDLERDIPYEDLGRHHYVNVEIEEEQEDGTFVGRYQNEKVVVQDTANGPDPAPGDVCTVRVLKRRDGTVIGKGYGYGFTAPSRCIKNPDKTRDENISVSERRRHEIQEFLAAFGEQRVETRLGFAEERDPLPDPPRRGELQAVQHQLPSPEKLYAGVALLRDDGVTDIEMVKERLTEEYGIGNGTVMLMEDEIKDMLQDLDDFWAGETGGES